MAPRRLRLGKAVRTSREAKAIRAWGWGPTRIKKR